jgi:RAD51-like protein 2
MNIKRDQNLSQPIPIAHLPLRRTTNALLRACGFQTVKEVFDTVQRKGGISNLINEFRPFRSNENNNIDSNFVIDAIASDERFAQNIYQEIIDAVNIVMDDSTMCNRNMNGMGLAHNVNTSTARTAADLLRIHTNIIGINSTMNTNIITFCRALDELLDGGIAIGELTELAGSPGSGKTTLCMQLAVNAALPYYCGGVQGRTVYIDTEGSFAPERCYDLATHLIQHVQTGLRRKHRQSMNNGSTGTTSATNHIPPEQRQWNVSAEDILNNILVYRVHDVADLSAVVHGALPVLLSSTPPSNGDDIPIRLVIIDSIAFPYRAVSSVSESTSSSNAMDYVTRTQQLTATAAALTSISVQYQLAVVAVNQMTTKFTTETIVSDNCTSSANHIITDSNATLQRSKLIPALGESWAHAVTSRLILSKPLSWSSSIVQQPYEHRVCTLTKSPRLSSGEASLVIVNAGIRGTEYIEATKRTRTVESDSNPSRHHS